MASPDLDHQASPPAGEPAAARAGRLRRPLRVVALLMILAGAGIGGYVVFQNWWSGAATGRAQDELADRFDQRIEQATAGEVPELGPRPAGGDSPEITAPDAGAVEAEFTDADDVPVLVGGDGTVTRVNLEAPDDLRKEYAPPPGDVVGRIIVPEIDLSWLVVEGVTAAHLARGPGHMPGTVIPGQFGNAVISGHRTTNGAPFGDLDLLEPGSQIFVETLLGVHTYEVVETRIVQPTEVWVATQWDGGWLTLTTCHPKHSAAQRLVVFAHLVDGPNADAIAAVYPPPYAVPGPTIR
jgi:LPXTG-site transpeptidase (sortase) family protein